MTAFLFFTSLLGWTLFLAYALLLDASKDITAKQAELIEELMTNNEELSTQCENLIDRVNDLELEGGPWKE